MKHLSSTHRLLIGLILLVTAVIAFTQSSSQVKDQLAASVDPYATKVVIGFNFITTNHTPTPEYVLPTPFLTPTLIPIPQEMGDLFDQQMAQYDAMFVDRTKSLVTNPDSKSYDYPQGGVYQIPPDQPPTQTEFCLQNYGAWANDFPHVFSWCPVVIEEFQKLGLSVTPISGVNSNLFTVDKMFAQQVKESAGDSHVISYAGSAGLGQVMPRDGIIDLDYANSCLDGTCDSGKKNPPDTPEARQAYIDFYSSCNGENWKDIKNKYIYDHDNKPDTVCNNPAFQFWNRPTIGELFSTRNNIAWHIESMTLKTTKLGFIGALETYLQGSTGSNLQYTDPICNTLASHSQERCK